MNKKLFSLSVFTIALAVAFVFSAPKGAKAADSINAAVSNHNHRGYIENRSANSFGEDWATNGGAGNIATRTKTGTFKGRFLTFKFTACRATGRARIRNCRSSFPITSVSVKIYLSLTQNLTHGGNNEVQSKIRCYHVCIYVRACFGFHRPCRQRY